MSARRQRVNVGRIVTARKSERDHDSVASSSRSRFRRMPRATAEPIVKNVSTKQTTSATTTSEHPWVKLHKVSCGALEVVKVESIDETHAGT